MTVEKQQMLNDWNKRSILYTNSFLSCIGKITMGGNIKGKIMQHLMQRLVNSSPHTVIINGKKV